MHRLSIQFSASIFCLIVLLKVTTESVLRRCQVQKSENGNRQIVRCAPIHNNPRTNKIFRSFRKKIRKDQESLDFLSDLQHDQPDNSAPQPELCKAVFNAFNNHTLFLDLVNELGHSPARDKRDLISVCLYKYSF